MSRFADTLRHINQRLSLPEPSRSRVLLEIAADLEGLYEHFSAQGKDDAEAIALALEHAELSDAALERLVEVHTAQPGRLSDRLSERTAAGWERVLLVLVALFALGLIGREIATLRLFEQASAFVWPLTGVAVVGLALMLCKACQLLFRRGHELGSLRRGLPTLLSLSVLSVLVGGLGCLIEMHSAALQVQPTGLSLAHESVMCLARVAPMVGLSLVVAVVLAVAWFILGAGVGLIERHRAARLMVERSEP
jgi:hypothetical protein